MEAVGTVRSVRVSPIAGSDETDAARVIRGSLRYRASEIDERLSGQIAGWGDGGDWWANISRRRVGEDVSIPRHIASVTEKPEWRENAPIERQHALVAPVAGVAHHGDRDAPRPRGRRDGVGQWTVNRDIQLHCLSLPAQSAGRPCRVSKGDGTIDAHPVRSGDHKRLDTSNRRAP